MMQISTTDLLSESEDQVFDQASNDDFEGQVASLTRANEILVCEKQAVVERLRIAQAIWAKIHQVLGSMSPKWIQEGGGIPIEDAACLAIASSFKDSNRLRAENSDWQSAAAALHVACPGWLKNDAKITDCARAAILGFAEKTQKLKKKIKKLKKWS